MRYVVSVIVILLLSVCPILGRAQADAATKGPVTDLDMQFLIEPVDPSRAFFQLETQIDHRPAPVLIGGNAYLTYEMFLSNVGAQAFKINRVDILDGDRPDRVLASYNSDQLLEMIRSYQRIDPASDQSLTLRPGVRAVLYFMPEFRNRGAIPGKIIHRFMLQALDQSDSADSSAGTLQMHAATTPIDGSSPMIIGVPLHGEHWLVANGPSNSSLHRRLYLANHGIVFYPERFAIDFMKFGPNGMLYQGDASDNKSYFGYGANVYSVAAGKVVSVIDGVPDNTPNSGDYPRGLATIAGNYVLVQIGKTHYALYANLMPKSIKVKRGDLLVRGQLIAQVGNSGNSDAPHLHFDITDRPSLLSTQGLPYGFAEFALESYSVPNPNANEPRVIFSKKPVLRKNELVRENVVVNFEGK